MPTTTDIPAWYVHERPDSSQHPHPLATHHAHTPFYLGLTLFYKRCRTFNPPFPHPRFLVSPYCRGAIKQTRWRLLCDTQWTFLICWDTSFRCACLYSVCGSFSAALLLLKKKKKKKKKKKIACVAAHHIAAQWRRYTTKTVRAICIIAVCIPRTAHISIAAAVRFILRNLAPA